MTDGDVGMCLHTRLWLANPYPAPVVRQNGLKAVALNVIASKSHQKVNCSIIIYYNI